MKVEKITTKGDQIKDMRLSKIGGKGLFSNNIEKQLKDKKTGLVSYILFENNKILIDQNRKSKYWGPYPSHSVGESLVSLVAGYAVCDFYINSWRSLVLEKNYEIVKAIHEGVTMTRNLVTEPPNVMTPPELAKNASSLEKIGVKVTILGEKEMTKLGMGSLLSVGRGSEHESKLAIMEWKGHKNKKKKPIAFIGKGVSFDTGGVSLKPAGGMEEMKYDMGGSGVVIGLMKTLALRKAKANVIGVVGLVENHIGNMATRPSDVVKSYSGQTIEVLNTDAEGRLVLADALWYTQEKYKPELMVDLATLTGAIIIAIGNEYAGLFSNNDKLSKQLEDAGKIEDEKLWRFPLHDKFDKMINSPIADMQNISSGRGAGSITAAQFLQRFVNKVPWAHLDIAGTTWSKTNLPTSPKGATAFGVKLLNKFVSKYHEGK